MKTNICRILAFASVCFLTLQAAERALFAMREHGKWGYMDITGKVVIKPTRTPYNASNRIARNDSPHMLAVLPLSDELFGADDYIRVFQDVRGKYKSEGDYIMTRPVRGALNPTQVDHVTDAYDTIDWLVKHTPESNGRVGMSGSSGAGFTVLMALLDPHPALNVAVPESLTVDGWMGDDWFHFGTFRQPNFDYTNEQTTTQNAGDSVERDSYDDYEAFRTALWTPSAANRRVLKQR